ncbi:MAG: low specificity L-threonine aldolase [Bacteroidales bacterium]|nr:low specificity L-threonine aldolase [Bacteroidales bacterium]
MKSFASDNNSGIDERVINAIIQTNNEDAFGYGDDEWTRKTEKLFKDTFGEETFPLIVFNGTGANSVALQIATRAFESILCAETAHIYVDECGAPCKMTGSQIRPIATKDGKLTPDLILPYLHGFNDQHHSQPKTIYISQCTELGTVYTKEELKALTEFAHKYNMYVHMDGARLANAAVFLNTDLRSITTNCGIDILSFGGTKNGLMIGEAVVVLNPNLAASAKFIRKQSAQLASKMRYLSCQFIPYLQENIWRENAIKANQSAQYFKDALSEFPEIEFTQKVETNALFLKMPKTWIDEMLNKYFFYFWNEDNNEIRLVTSFNSTKEDIDGFIDVLKKTALK